MLRRALPRLSSQYVGAPVTPTRPANIPKVICSFGWEERINFGSHPGVMSVAKLLELNLITRMRATFTQDQINEMKEYDAELARKAQVALDNGIAINFQELENIDQDLPRLKQEKDQLMSARKSVLAAPKGTYKLDGDVSACFPAPKPVDKAAVAAAIKDGPQPLTRLID